ncbi:MAG: N-acetylmuramoyl-L-alanine amidase, partial [Actinomycetota bacterium]
MAIVRSGIYLEQNRPRRSQFLVGRREPIRSVIVVHTAESGTDRFGSDPRAENVARFIRDRSDAGSYHLIGDADSIVQLVRFENEAFQDGSGSNPWAIGISLAMNAADWPRLSSSRRTQFTDTAAQMASIAARWLSDRGLPVPEARLLTKAESERANASGFISHARRDPTRRSDPGASFPWSAFFRTYQQYLSNGGLGSDPDTLVREL